MDGSWDGGYRERPSRFERAVVWTRAVTDADTALPVLPDGCIDLLWVDGALVVAGPDTRAFRPSAAIGTRYVGLRFAPGTAPALLGVPAHELRDQRIELADVWASGTVRRLTEQLGAADDPVAALEQIALRRAAEVAPPDPVLPKVVAALDAGWSVAATAEAAGLNARLLHRRSLAAFGYGPKTLARVLRMQRALALARRGMSFADIAVSTGFADQAHLAREMRDLAGMPLGQVLSRSAEASLVG
ncbi:helix-turn-helix transcriptional regulator [Nocardia ninae]|uniref:AraC family transcriptional regulator n=1 Tax=Nocardia ninae NBRC 108245 TaxID=1210091 RepID=A0A511MGC9_9NOCA|nr:helix-turn-helix transcriptional regulator [Nocardia ninae]GEM39137.1 AraC family transcriptional regulator [Nocardia ninae NBRC 108245]